jgi:hypothetical protein
VTTKLLFTSGYVSYHLTDISKREFNRYIKGVKEDDIETFNQQIDDGLFSSGCEYSLDGGFVELRVNNRKFSKFTEKFNELYISELSRFESQVSKVMIYGKSQYSLFGMETYSSGSYELEIDSKFDFTKLSIELEEFCVGNTKNRYSSFTPLYDGVPFEYSDREDHDSDYMVFNKDGKCSWVEFD